jgi:poly(A) polymerase
MADIQAEHLLRTGEEPSSEPAPIPEELIDPDALKVVRRLRRHGFAAYLVGGGVRDLLLGRRPKDFDIATAATPNEVRKLFRNCRVIGRRFRLAHIHFRDNKILEVSTFRASPHAGDDLDLPEELLIRRDNTFGTAEQDARRRDFTINGLFYDTDERLVIDYVGGLGDLAAGLVRTIGEPEVRFREDPIRILRALKFAARLTFDVDPASWRAAIDLRGELEKAAPPRVLEEIFRMLKGGAAARSLRLLAEVGMLPMLLPELQRYLPGPSLATAATEDELLASARLSRYLEALDELYRDEISPPNAVLLAAMVAPLIVPAITPDSDDPGPQGARSATGMIEEALQSMSARLRISRRDVERARQVLAVQRRLLSPRRSRGRPEALASRDFFGDALLLLEIGCRATGFGEDVLEWWSELRQGGSPPPEPRDGEEPPTGGEVRGRRRRRRGGRRKRGSDEGSPRTP